MATNGMDVSCPLPEDLMNILKTMLELYTDAVPLLEEEDIYS